MAKPFDAREIRRALEDEIESIVKKDAEAITRALVLSTPVGNPALWQSPPPVGYKPGLHRGAWAIGFASSDGQAPGAKDTTGGSTIARAFALIRRYKIGLRMTLNNAAPAIVRLNQGWSTQAPAGFIEQAVAIARSRSLLPDVKELP